MPIAGHATLDGVRLHLRGLVGTADGARILRAQAQGPAGDPEALGVVVAEDLLRQGAAAILDALHHA